MVMDMQVMIAVSLGALGLVLGSFSGATVWRLRARQLRNDENNGEKVNAKDKRSIAKLKPRAFHKDRSVCLHCGHDLKWYDLIPIASWLSTRGKCRYCRKPIGKFEPIVEISLSLFFVLSFLFWPGELATPLELAQFAIWLIAGTGMAILFAYDMKWFLLPDAVTFPLIGLGAVNALLYILASPSPLESIFSVAWSCLILGGLYYAIYVFSKKQWVGFGDVKLGLALGLLIANWQYAILTLFLANLIGTIIILPLLASGVLRKGAHVPFGPLLISGWAIAGIFGGKIIGWYLSLMLGV